MIAVLLLPEIWVGDNKFSSSICKSFEQLVNSY